MEQKTDFAAMGLFDAKAPRYTSYPTAPHFSDRTGPQDMRAWIRDIEPGSEISLYLHVPFCRHLCWFCACRTQGTQSDAPVRIYLQTLKSEIDMLAADMPEGVRLARMHWGGGTPTLMDAGMITDLAGHVANVLPFADGAEFSVEIDPGEIDASRTEALAQAGMTRASIGVQDFDPEIQKLIGRIQSFERTAEVVDMLRATGINSLNTDILFGLPTQTRAKITTSVQKLLSLAPDRVALYGYAHVPWMARRQQLIPSDLLPTPAERLDLFNAAERLFAWDGYAQIGIDHFARPGDSLETAQRSGRLRRNFQGYTDDTNATLIGLGASSISRFPQGYAQNAPATSAYTKSVRAGTYATTRGHTLSAEDHLRARLIEMLMCDFSIDAAAFPIPDQPLIKDLMRRAKSRFGSALHLTNNILTIRRDAHPMARMIAREFDGYEMNEAGHSTAI